MLIKGGSIKIAALDGNVITTSSGGERYRIEMRERPHEEEGHLGPEVGDWLTACNRPASAAVGSTVQVTIDGGCDCRLVLCYLGSE